MKRVVLAVLIFTVGCSRQPPDSIYIDQKFTAQETAVIKDAIDSWCVAVGWCPTIQVNAEALIRLVPKITGHNDYLQEACPSVDCELIGWNDNPDIQISMRAAKDLDRLWRVVAHEIGHYCADHTNQGLMYEAYEENAPLIIDHEATRAWRSGCY